MTHAALAPWLQKLEHDGFAVVHDVFPAHFMAEIADGDQDYTHARRNLIRDCAWARDLAGTASIRSLVEPVLGSGAFAVRGILFDKNPAANWKVAWHQDVTIEVAERREIPGFGPWSLKEGVTCVQAPASVLERMLTVRVHVDDCDEHNGPLRVLPGSHTRGVIPVHEIPHARSNSTEVTCCTHAGGILLMRPLLLHASSPATSPRHRRVIHLDFAADPLPVGLRWHSTRV